MLRRRGCSSINTSTSTTGNDIPASRRPTCHALALQLLRQYNPHTVSRAHNTLLQQSRSLAEAAPYLEALTTKTTDAPTTGGRPGNSGGGSSSSSGMALENESLAHLTSLCAQKSHWCKALCSLEELQQDNARRRASQPTAALHATVQFALERAPAPEASWAVPVSLFVRMCGAPVSISEVAFQSRKCFASGTTETALLLLQYMIRKGVRR